MNDNELLDLYTDYLISSFGATTGVGLARLLDGAVSHDRVQRYLAGLRKDGAEYWRVVKAICTGDGERRGGAYCG